MILRKKKSIATSNSAITVVSAFATGKGVTVGIDIPCRVIAEMVKRSPKTEEIEVVSPLPDPHQLVLTAAKMSTNTLGVKIPKDEALRLTIDSSIPPEVGLKSSSAVSVAVVKSVFDLFSPQKQIVDGSEKILKLSCKASIRAGASLTGAFDDAAAGLLGGLVFSDNSKFKLLEHRSIHGEIGSSVEILLPSNEKKPTSSLDLAMYHKYRGQIREAIQNAQQGLLVQAMFLNSIVHSLIHHYSMQPVVSALVEGASSAGVTGKGPAIASISPTSKISQRVTRRWLEENPTSTILSARVTKPKRGD